MPLVPKTFLHSLGVCALSNKAVYFIGAYAPSVFFDYITNLSDLTFALLYRP